MLPTVWGDVTPVTEGTASVRGTLFQKGFPQEQKCSQAETIQGKAAILVTDKALKGHTKDTRHCYNTIINTRERSLMKDILLIEDDHDICEVITDYFNTKGTAVTAVNDGEKALGFIDEGLESYGLVLLDIMLPNADGFTICRSIRKRSDIPVIFITARGREEDMIFGYDLGCDDYIVKPFLLSVLYMKCEAMMKRADKLSGQTALECGAIRLDTRMLCCFIDGKEIELPPKEFAILRYLMEHQDWTIDRDTILNRVWGYDYFGSDRVVDSHIKKLRKALGSAGKQIKTVVGRGYRLSQ